MAMFVSSSAFQSRRQVLIPASSYCVWVQGAKNHTMPRIKAAPTKWRMSQQQQQQQQQQQEQPAQNITKVLSEDPNIPKAVAVSPSLKAVTKNVFIRLFMAVVAIFQNIIKALLGSTGIYKPSKEFGDVDKISRVMVVGAAGRVGMRTVNTLGQQFPDVKVQAFIKSKKSHQAAFTNNAVNGGNDSLMTQYPPLYPQSVEVFQGDITDGSLEKAIRKFQPDTIVWTAGSRNPKEVDNMGVKKAIDALGKTPKMRMLAEQMYKPLFDFGKTSDVALFQPLDDVIMGGVSKSEFVKIPGKATAEFRGVASTDNNGGFCQVRNQYFTKTNPVPSKVLDFSGWDGIELRVKGDGRRYKLNLKNTTEPEFVFQQSFDTSKSGEDEIIRLPFSKFLPMKRGKLAFDNGSAIYSDKLDVSSIVGVAFVYSKFDIGGLNNPTFEPGTFRLQISSMRLYRLTPPRFILLSSAAVTRPSWSEERKTLYPKSYNIPIVSLNPGNILTEKYEGEQHVRQLCKSNIDCAIPYTVIRATGLNDTEVPSNRFLNLMQGDTASGRIHRQDIANLISKCLSMKECSFKTFEVESKPNVFIQSDEEIQHRFTELVYDQ